MFGGLHVPEPFPSEGGLLQLAHDFTPRVEVVRPTLLLLGLEGLGRLWPTVEALGQALFDSAQRRAAAACVALAATSTAALIVARGRPGLSIIPSGGEALALAPLPIGLLDLTEEQAAVLRRWGLTTLGELAALPARGLAERLGPEGPRLRRVARGEEARLLAPTALPETFEMALDLDWPIEGLEPLSFVLLQLLEPLCQRLLACGHRAAALTLELRLVDGGVHRRVLRPAAPSVEPRTWRTLLLVDLETHAPPDAVRALSVRAETTGARAVQFSLLDRARPAPERLAETLARLSAWTADGRAGSPTLLDTHRPDAFALATFDPPPWRGTARVDTPTPHASLRLFRPPLAVRVALKGEVPTLLTGSVRGAVVECAGPWRTSGDWWESAWSREEWDVALADGGLYRLFRDRLTQEWYLAGSLD